jgi:hypothetical protein
LATAVLLVGAQTASAAELVTPAPAAAAAAPAPSAAAPAPVAGSAPVTAAAAPATEPAMPVSWMGFQVGGDCRDGSAQQAYEQLAQRGYELPDAALRCPVDVASPAPLRARLRKLAADGSVSEVEDLVLEYPSSSGRLARIVWTRAWAPGAAAPSEAQLREQVFGLLGAPALVYDRVQPQPLAADAAASGAAAVAPAPVLPAGDGLAFTAAWATVQKKAVPATLYVLSAADWSRGTSRMGGVLTVAHVNRVAPRDTARPQYLRIDMRDSGYRVGR